MPVVEVKMWKGRSEEDKARIIKGITKVFVDLGIYADVACMHDTPKRNWGSGGKACAY